MVNEDKAALVASTTVMTSCVVLVQIPEITLPRLDEKSNKSCRSCLPTPVVVSVTETAAPDEYDSKPDELVMLKLVKLPDSVWNVTAHENEL